MGKKPLQPLDLIKTSEHLVNAKNGKPTQANLRRATSTTYYALFHCLARSCADLLVGGASSDRSKHAWKQVYRALEHGQTKNNCNKTAILNQFPPDIIDFANNFISMQTKRHKADYDPSEKFYKSSVKQDIADTKDVIERFRNVPPKDRRAFATYVLFKNRS